MNRNMSIDLMGIGGQFEVNEQLGTMNIGSRDTDISTTGTSTTSTSTTCTSAAHHHTYVHE
jgi:hypothetical protein